MKMKEILERQTDQLREELVEKQKHLFELRSQAVTEKLEDPSQLGKAKKDIARILTAMRQRETEKQPTGNKARAEAQEQGRQAAAGRLAAAELAETQPAFGRRTRVNAVKQKVRARKTGGGKSAARKLKARTEMYRHRRKGRAANSK
jgi:large subunit ribosomal protein L29